MNFILLLVRCPHLFTFRAIYLGWIMWPEVQTAKAEQRHELVLHGKDVSDRVQAAGGCVDEEVFSLVKLNFLEISEAKLQSVPETLSSLVNLTSLVLKSNQLTKVPDGINRWLWKKSWWLGNCDYYAISA